MSTEDAMKYFTTQSNIADALGITQAAVSQWGDRPPMLRQFQMQIATSGGLMADE